MTEKINKILILEDVPADAELSERELRKGGLVFISKIVSTEEDFTNALDTFMPDLILSDYSLPQFDGLSALTIAQATHPDIPVIFVTGTMGDDLAVQTIKNGAVDYILKQKIAQLFPAVERVFRDKESIAKEKELEQKKSDFITLASHQLRTPLSGTKWLIETLRREILGPLNPKQKEYLEKIYLINERMVKLVFHILNAMNFEDAALSPQQKKIPVFDLFERICRSFEPTAKDKKIFLHNALAKEKGVVVETDEAMLSLIIDTFVSNAIDYSSVGGDITLDTVEHNGFVVLSVKDTGIGIPKDEQNKVFDRFYRASNAKLHKPDGSGLGLYVAQLIVKKIGGVISFESGDETGTIFSLRLPKSPDSLAPE